MPGEYFCCLCGRALVARPGGGVWDCRADGRTWLESELNDSGLAKEEVEEAAALEIGPEQMVTADVEVPTSEEK